MTQNHNQTKKSKFEKLEGFISLEDLEKTLEPDITLKTGIKGIDENAPIALGQNTIITARTGKGKTVLGVNITNGLLDNNEDIKILVMSIELTKKDFLQRLLCNRENIALWKVKRGFQDKEQSTHQTQKEKYTKGAMLYAENFNQKILIYDSVNTIEEVDETIKNLEDKHNFIPNYILVDYANILSVKNLTETNKHIQISHWAKFLSKRKNYHIQLICQANRATIEKNDGFARTENLADSDQYGRDAFVVYSINSDADKKEYSINPTKNRNGQSEKVFTLSWNPESGKLEEQKETIRKTI